ncbi:MAG: DUF4229 domain-containing protein [Candidatus Nanopelagicales bacterium]
MRGIVLYTGLRLALLAIVWLLIQAVTPLRGLLAAAAAIVVSGLISFIALDRPRNQASSGFFGIFRGIDERIERSRTAEDYDDPAETVAVLGEGEAQPEQQTVAEGEQPGPLQDRDQGAPGSPA